MKERSSTIRWMIILSALFFTALLACSASAEIKIAADPTRMGVGARFLGMGKGGLALGDDCEAIYLNPAGIALLDDWQVSSMQGKFVNEINFIQLTGAYPTYYGMIGLGFVRSNISYSTPIATLVSTEAGYRVIPDPSGGTYNYTYNNNVILLSYGSKIKNIIDWDITKDITFGTNLKIFNVGITGSGITGGTAIGFDADVGFLWAPKDSKWIKVGATGQNILPFNLGGKLVWESGQEENYPSTQKIGLAAKLLGKDAPYQYDTQEFFLTTDAEFTILKKDFPIMFHVGIEWWPMTYLALRGGIDQDVVGTGIGTELETTNNMTAGVGLLYGGFRFDYAYHQYNDIPANDTHYFSIAYNIGKVPPRKVIKKRIEVVKKRIEIVEPADKSIVYEDIITLKGRVYDPKIRRVKVLGTPVKIDKKGMFYAKIRLNIGKNPIVIEGFAKEDKKVETLIHRVLRLKTFKDVDQNFWAKKTIDYLGTLGIMTGYPDGTFRPKETITRAEITTLLIRSKWGKVESPEVDPFPDVPVRHWAARYVSVAKDLNIVRGYPDGTFKPSNVVTRVEGVILITRSAELKEPEFIIEAPFIDIPGRHWASKTIATAKRGGLLRYLKGKPFEPKKGLTRAEASEVLSKTPFSKERIDNLLNFDVGYEYPSPEAAPTVVTEESMPEVKPKIP